MSDRAPRNDLTADVLRALVRYEPETGQFIRLTSPTRAAGKKLGQPAAQYRNSNGYALISLGSLWRVKAHQLAWLYMTGKWPIGDVNHINCIRTDNRWINLRAATRSQNIANSRLSKANTSGAKGVVRDEERQKWKAQIKVNYRNIILGRFDHIEDAIRARREAEERYFGEFARAA